jgi:hypothetical protein
MSDETKVAFLIVGFLVGIPTLLIALPIAVEFLWLGPTPQTKDKESVTP